MSLRTELDELISQINVVPTKNADDPLTELDWNLVSSNFQKVSEALKRIRDLPACTIPKGFLYVRFPGRPLPYGADGMFNWTSEFEWRKIHEQYAGDFLRLAGGNASAFKTDSEQINHDEKCKDGNNRPNTGGGQIDTLQEHQHSYVYYYAQEVVMKGQTHVCDIYNRIEKSFDCTGRTDIETRPTNITVEMYLYIPD